MTSNPGQCQALRIHFDAQRCTDEATSVNGLFCGRHSRQAFALYKGYKRRNARLDVVDDEAPPYLKDSQIPLANDNFESIEDVKTLQDIQSHLYDKYVLLNQVIEARKLHHKHFYSITYDYGHQAYLDKLSSQRHTVFRALGTVGKRLTKVLYAKEKWYAWVREVQDEEEANREKEQKKLKQEAALFRRHMKMLQARLELNRQQEEKMRQDAFLEEAYRERMSLADDDDDEAWDPINDLEFDKRHLYIDLIKHFLWMEPLDEDDGATPAEDAENDAPKEAEAAAAAEPQPPAKKSKKKAKGKGGASKYSSSADASGSPRGQKKLLAMQESLARTTAEDPEPDKNNIETEEEMRKRLSEGVKKNYDVEEGYLSFQLVGTLENPHETHEKTAPMTTDEIEQAVTDIKEIKLLLFCRLLLAQASLLPAAVRASGVREFLNDAEVAEADLRDLCLKFLAKSEKNMKGSKRKSRKKNKSRHKTKVTICGKSIWNHASEKAMSRDGWLQFSIMAKDCHLRNAIQLCRNWAEFSDLNFLTLWQYFPASNWNSWGSNRLIQQLQELGFYSYFVDLDAQQHSHRHQVGGRGQIRRQHDVVESRNILVGHMKRNDPVTRRFLQYLVMRTGELLVLVRDGKTGRVITAPPEEQLWTYRKKRGLGRASKNEWVNVLEVGPMYFALTETLRKWRFGFQDYYDVFIWDFVPGQSSMITYNIVVTELRNALRIAHPRDAYRHMEPLLRTLTREQDTMRTRQIKPGEDVKSLWDTVMDERNEFRLFDINGKRMTCHDSTELVESPYMFYNEANRAEDMVLFPDELVSDKKSVPFREIRNGASRIEDGFLPSTLRHLKKGMKAIEEGRDPAVGLDQARDDEDDSIWAVPKIWETGLAEVRQQKPEGERLRLLKRTGLAAARKTLTLQQRLGDTDPMQTMERDRSFGFKESFHAGDLEPGSNEKFTEVQERITTMLKHPHSGSTDWVWFLVEILDWLRLRADYDDYTQDPAFPWPHAFIIQDLVRAFAAVAMFFPEVETTALVTQYIQSSACEEFRNSLLFNPKERGKTRPDRRGRTSYKFRDKKFWTKWNEFLKTDRYFADVYPMEWSIAVRPIVAHLYRAGVIAPAYYQNDPECVSGMATANTEPHRPDQLDFFINYEDKYGSFPMEFPPSFITPDQWPELLPRAQKFAKTHRNARYALLRLWSAPHFYPFMVGLHNRQGTSFLDSVGRSWEWKFVPKDMPGSEFSAHRVAGTRLDLLRSQLGERVDHRGDLILVMGENAADLLKYTTAVMFALQTKPWLREVDLWKSFVNVDLELLEGLDPFWLD
ncbi:hypothetical protein ACJZ2D_013585 [Fusarium nematophilum]